MNRKQQAWIEIAAWLGFVLFVGFFALIILEAIEAKDDGIKPPKTQAFQVETPQGIVYECWMYENIVTCDYPGE